MAGGLAAWIGTTIHYHTYHIGISTHEVRIRNLPKELDGLRVVQLSDIHKSFYVKDDTVEEAVNRAMALHPDLICLTGDFVAGDADHIHPVSKILKALEAPLGVYGVLGNHDIQTDPEMVKQAMQDCCMPILVNEAVKIADGFWLAGLDDAGCGNPDLEKATRDIPEDEAFILMCHNPKILYDFGQDMFVLSGHTHGGQVKLTNWLNKRIIADLTNGGKFLSGWYSHKKTRMYVNRGVGTIGMPFRWFCPPEVALFVLFS